MQVLILLPTLLLSQPLHISSKQSGTFESGEYIVDEDINIPAEKKLILQPGTHLFFNPHTVLKVFGELLCEGTEENPIVFRTIATASDSASGDFIQWTGIIVAKRGAVSLSNCEIHSSLYGVQVPDTASILLFSNVTFENNDNQLIIGEEPVLAKDTSHYTFHVPKRKVRLTETTGAYKETRSPLLQVLQYTFLAGAIGGLIGTIYCKAEADTYDEQYKKQTEPQDISYYKSKREEFKRYTRIGLAGTIVSASACVLTVTINISLSRNKK